MAKLTEQQKRFVDEYLIDLNATRAYKAAYKNVKKDEVAASAAVRLLRNVKVQGYMKERQQALQERTSITQDMVLLELAKIAFSNGSDFAKVVTKPRKRQVWNETTQEYEEKEFEEQFVELIDTDKLPPEKRAAIAQWIKDFQAGAIKIETVDDLKKLIELDIELQKD